jgi:hypothetical protein
MSRILSRTVCLGRANGLRLYQFGINEEDLKLVVVGLSPKPGLDTYSKLDERV